MYPLCCVCRTSLSSKEEAEAVRLEESCCRPAMTGASTCAPPAFSDLGESCNWRSRTRATPGRKVRSDDSWEFCGELVSACELRVLNCLGLFFALYRWDNSWCALRARSLSRTHAVLSPPPISAASKFWRERIDTDSGKFSHVAESESDDAASSDDTLLQAWCFSHSMGPGDCWIQSRMRALRTRFPIARIARSCMPSESLSEPDCPDSGSAFLGCR